MIKSIEKFFIVTLVVSLAFGMVSLNYSLATQETNTTQTQNTQTQLTTVQTNVEQGYTATGDTVYATEKLNVRKSASSSSEKLGSLSKDASTKRIAVGDNGWDKVEFNGETGYVVSKYLTTQNPTLNGPKWTSTGDVVYSTRSLNVRSGTGTSYDSIGGLILGQKLTRIAVGDNGWDKIQYEGKEAYVMSKYLTTSKSEVDKLVEEQKAKQANEIENNTIVENNTVDGNNIVEDTNTVNNTTSENTVTDGYIYNKIVDDIGVIPQVGKSIVDYIYIIMVILGLMLTCFVGLNINRKNEE